MAVIVFCVVTFVSSAILGVWSFRLLRDYFKINYKLIEGEKTLFFYLVVSIFGMVLSAVLLIGWLIQ